MSTGIRSASPNSVAGGLYRQLGGNVEAAEMELALLWVLNQSDGNHSLLDIAERANLRFALVHTATALLLESGLLKEREGTVAP